MGQIEELDVAIRTLMRVLVIDERRLSSRLHAEPFNPIDLETLSYLQRHPGVPAKDIATFLGVRATTMQSVIDRLQKRGLVDRDCGVLKGRAVALTLTAAGVMFREQMHDQNLANCTQMLGAIAQSERADFVKNMTKIAAGIKAV